MGCDCAAMSCYECTKIRKIVWRAALEWIKDMVIHQSDGPSNPKDLIQCIEEELADESTNSNTENKN